MSKNIFKEKSFEFAVDIAKLYKLKLRPQHEFVLSRQLLASSTSIGANYKEAEHAESKVDFIHKLAISQKECNESIYWLDVLNAAGFLKEDDFIPLKDKAVELMKLITAIIKTSKASLPKRR